MAHVQSKMAQLEHWRGSLLVPLKDALAGFECWVVEDWDGVADLS